MISLKTCKPLLLAGIALLLLGQGLPVLAQCDCRSDCDHGQGCCPSTAEPTPMEDGGCCAGETGLATSQSDDECRLKITCSIPQPGLASASCTCHSFLGNASAAAVTPVDSPAGKRVAEASSPAGADGEPDLTSEACSYSGGFLKIPPSVPPAIYLVNSCFLS